MQGCMWVGGWEKDFQSIQAVVTSIPKKRFSVCGGASVVLIGSKAHSKKMRMD